MKILIRRVLLAAGILLLAAGVVQNATAQTGDLFPKVDICDFNANGEILGVEEERCVAGEPVVDVCDSDDPQCSHPLCDKDGDNVIAGEGEEQCKVVALEHCDTNDDDVIMGEGELQCRDDINSCDLNPDDPQCSHPLCDKNGDGVIMGEDEGQCKGIVLELCDKNSDGVITGDDPVTGEDEGQCWADIDSCDLNGEIPGTEKELCKADLALCDKNDDRVIMGEGEDQCITNINPCDTNHDGFVMGTGEEQCKDETADIKSCDFNRDGHVDSGEKRECGQATEFQPCDFNLDDRVDLYEQRQCDNAPPTDENVALSDLVEQLPDELKNCINTEGELICSLERFIEACGELIPATCEIINYFLDPCDFNANGELDEFEKDACGGDQSGTNACDFNGDKTVDEAEMEQCAEDPCRLDLRAPGCPLYCDANPEHEDCKEFIGLPEYCENPDILPECDIEENPYPPRYCGMLPLPRELFEECHPWTPEDFGIDPIGMTGADPWAKFHADPNAYRAIDEEDFELIPLDAFGYMDSTDMQHFDENALAGMTLEQFMKIPDDRLDSLHAGNMGGLPWEVIQEITLDELGHLDTQEFQQMDAEDIGEFFVHFDIEDISYDDIQKFIPSDWKIDETTGDITPPPGTHVVLPEIGNRDTLARQGLHLPPLPDFARDFSLGGKAQSGKSFLDDANQTLKDNEFGEFTFSQNDSGILIIRGPEEVEFSYLPDPDDLVQVGDDVLPGISLDEDGYPVMITPDHRQFALRPAPKNPDELRQQLGAEVHIGDDGDVLVKLPDLTVPFIFEPEVKPAPEGVEPGPHVEPNGDIFYVYEDGTAQQVYPAPYLPDSLERALAAIDTENITDLRFKPNGTITGKYYSRSFVLRPNWTTQVEALPEGVDTLSPGISDSKVNEDGSFSFKYKVQLPDSQTETRTESTYYYLDQDYDGYYDDWE
ncbi:MAG: hypothetical protein GY862_13775 [Gammaproteobacteria bacterium]|nr:hypothetical protein [Gammaproteobacteria bacterium]